MVNDVDNNNNNNNNNNDDNMITVALGQPTLRTWELTSNSSRYDKIIASPSDHELVIMWSIWVAVSFVCFVYVGAVLWAVLTTTTLTKKKKGPKTKENPFNLYLAYGLFPDFLALLFCGMTCAMNVSHGHYWGSGGMCKWQSFYVIWNVTSNSWLLAVIVWQLYRMLSCSRIRMKFVPPTYRQVTVQACGVYVWAAFLGIWGTVQVPHLPHRTLVVNGQVCLPSEYNTASTLFFFLVFYPLIFVVPFGYAAYVCFNVYRHKLMPPAGRRRLLTIYFLRIISVYFNMCWVYILMVGISTMGGYPWVTWVGGLFLHFQAPLSATFVLRKPDIWKSMKQILSCQTKQHDEEDNENNNNNNYEQEATTEFGNLHPRRFSSGFFGSWFNTLRSPSNKTLNAAITDRNDDDDDDNDDDDYMPIQNLDFTFDDEVVVGSEQQNQQQEHKQPTITNDDENPSMEEGNHNYDSDSYYESDHDP